VINIDVNFRGISEFNKTVSVVDAGVITVLSISKEKLPFRYCGSTEHL